MRWVSGQERVEGALIVRAVTMVWLGLGARQESNRVLFSILAPPGDGDGELAKAGNTMLSLFYSALEAAGCLGKWPFPYAVFAERQLPQRRCLTRHTTTWTTPST